MAMNNQMMLMLGAVAVGGFFLWQRSRKGGGRTGIRAAHARVERLNEPIPGGTPGLVDSYANRLDIKRAVIDETSGVVAYQDDSRGTTFGSFRDAARFNQARGRAV